jgi:hypothetical protein
MSHGSENEEEEGNPYVQCCYLPPSEEKRVNWIQWIIYQLIDQAKAALPVVSFVFCFMLVILGRTPSDVMELAYGMLFVIVGLVFFMYGLEFGVMPMGDKIGMLLPSKVHWAVMYFIAGIIGIAVTYAEPAIGVTTPTPTPLVPAGILTLQFRFSRPPLSWCRKATPPTSTTCSSSARTRSSSRWRWAWASARGSVRATSHASSQTIGL